MPTRIKHWIELQLQIKYELWMSKSLEQTPQPKIPGKAFPVFRSQSLPLVQSHRSEEATVAALSPLKSRTMPMNSSNVRSCKTKRKGEEWWPLPPASHAYQLGRSPWSSFNTFQLPLRHLILLKYEVHEVDECKKLRSRGREREMTGMMREIYWCLWFVVSNSDPLQVSACAHWSLHKSSQIIYFASVKPHRRPHREALRQPSCCPEASPALVDLRQNTRSEEGTDWKSSRDNAYAFVCMYVCMMDVCMYGCMHASMHACVYVCVDVCMHASMHVCMYACMHVCMYACMACMHGCMDAWMHVCMYACLHVCMSACLHVCMSACLHVCMSCMPACLHVCMSACLHVCMSACLHVCMSACLHVCMYACMQVCMHACMYVCMYASMQVCMPACMHACMHVCMYVYTCMHVCMYVYIYIHYLDIYIYIHYIYMLHVRVLYT